MSFSRGPLLENYVIVFLFLVEIAKMSIWNFRAGWREVLREQDRDLRIWIGFF